ncbi:Adenine DNA glycosylase [Fundidesulfovibrio magnetotacticus]|uniref:Adenine DNA glycosylase n=1 Tax=Fundidesulfovibrio magnetotacticus TaxID=2730080 RepID=A0A6V8LKE5_9BACT|nr:endonuclease III domain-containing protein [Fundidesulfovibrio magnetotacticus]GFK93182.1 Adenine DNA glycosylase [Fundidesulfovibrio magnetotacticus]
MSRRETLHACYDALLAAHGHRAWWPARTPFEVCVGAVLTQNTSWKGVEKAIENLDAAGALAPRVLRSLDPARVEALIRPAGHFRVKTRRLANLLEYLDAACGFDFDALAARPMDAVRGELLEVKGVGPETADCILCYALGMPSFVVDAYTRRILSRHGLVPEDIDYHELRDYFMDVLDPDTALFNDFHAQLVRVGNLYCKARSPRCDVCPLSFMR